MSRLPRPPSWFEFGLLAQVAAGALMIGLGIGSAPFWLDELASASVAERNLGDIFRVLGNTDANMGFYYLVLHAWMWGGDSEAWVRALSALPAVATIPTTAILARRLFGDAVGLVAGFLLAGSMYLVAYAQFARAYALAIFLITAATLLFVEAIRTRRPGLFLAYGAASVLAVYMSPLSGLVLVAHVASLPFLPQARDLVRPFGLTYGAVLLAVAPLAVTMSVVGAEQVSWIERPGLSDLVEAARWMLGVNSRSLAVANRSLAVAYGALIVIGLVALWWDRVSREQQAETWRWRRSLVIGWLLLPPVLLFLFSQAQPLWSTTYLFGSAPAMAITAAIGLVALARRSRALAAFGTVIVICLAVLARIGLEPRSQEDFSGLARMIASQSRTGDGIAYGPNARLGIDWYEREAAPSANLPIDFAVAEKAEDVGQIHPREVSPATFVSRLRHYPRVWLVWYSSSNGHPTGEPLLDAGLSVLRSEYRRVRRREFDGLSVELYERTRGRLVSGGGNESVYGQDLTSAVARAQRRSPFGYPPPARPR